MIEDMKKNLGLDGRSGGMGKRIIAFVLFGLIILVFVFLGMAPDQLGVSGGGVVAQVNNTTISLAEFRNTVQRYEQQMGGSQPGVAQFIRGQALESLIDREVFYQGSQEAGLLVSSAEVRDIIVNIPAFQENGRFQRLNYESVLRQNRLKVGQFELDMHKEAARGRLQRLLALAVEPTKGLLASDRALSDKQTNLEFVKFSKKDLAAAAEKSVSVPAQLDAETEKKAKTFYDNNLSDYQQKEEIRARHILIKFKEGDAKGEKEALAKIQALAKEAEKGNFSELAKKNSQDTGSAVKGGDLGFFGRGQMVKPFEEAAFALPVGQLSAPVKSRFGYHLIKVEEKKKPETKSFDSVKGQIAKKVLARDRAESEISDLKKALSGGDFGKAKAFVQKNGLKWEETGEFDLSAASIPKIGDSEELLIEAFRLKSGQSTKKVFEVNGQSYWVRGKASKAAPSASKAEDNAESLRLAHANDAFRQLRDQWRKEAEIQRNSRYLQQESQF